MLSYKLLWDYYYLTYSVFVIQRITRMWQVNLFDFYNQDNLFRLFGLWRIPTKNSADNYRSEYRKMYTLPQKEGRLKPKGIVPLSSW